MAEALVVRNLSKRFGGLRAVQDLSFAVAEGETLALIGPNGAGKTTSFHLITGYHRADAGSIIAFGRELAGLRPYDICAHGLARTFQVARPFGARAQPGEIQDADTRQGFGHDLLNGTPKGVASGRARPRRCRAGEGARRLVQRRLPLEPGRDLYGL